MMDDAQYKSMIEAADFFNNSSRELLNMDGKFHAGTLIGAVARMAGSLMYRSFDIQQEIDPGTIVLSEQANIYGPKLLNVMYTTLQHLGDEIGEDNTDSGYASSGTMLLTFKESYERLAMTFLGYCDSKGISFHDAALGAAIATGLIVHDCRNLLPVEKGVAVAVYGFIEGTKTAPFPLDMVAH